MAGELDIPIWTATQVNRAGLSQEVVDIEHMGDSLRKAQIADVVIGICRTREERDKNEARLYLAKNRNGPTGPIIKIKTAYDKMIFYVPGTVPNTQPIVGKKLVVGRRTPKSKAGKPAAPTPVKPPVKPKPIMRRKPKAGL
jgi:hypothetical protein